MQLAAIYEVPYYAVIFTNLQTESLEGYAEMADEMEWLGREQPGFLGIDSARSGVGITVSYWRTLEDVRAWKANLDHLKAQRKGRGQWYARYTVRVAKVERNYECG